MERLSRGPRLFWIVTAALALIPLAHAAGAQSSGSQRFAHAPSGISMDVPAGWVRLQGDRAGAPDAGATPTGGERQAAMAQLADSQTPLFFFVDDVTVHPAQTARVSVRVLRGRGDSEGAVDDIIATINTPVDSMIVRRAERTQVSGLPAARAAMRQPGGDGPNDILSRAWFVPRGAFVFMIEMASPEPTADEYDTLFADILSSVRIEP